MLRGPGEMMGTVLTAFKTICPGELLTTPRGLPWGQAPEVGAVWVNFGFMVQGALECEGRGLGDPPPTAPSLLRRR